MSNLRAINKAYIEHHENAFWHYYNPFLQLASVVEVEAKMTKDIIGNATLQGWLTQLHMTAPLLVGKVSDMTRLNLRGVNSTRYGVKVIKLEKERSLLSPSALGKLVKDTLMNPYKFGDNVLPVADPDNPQQPRSKWPHLRILRHTKPSNVHDAITGRNVGVTIDQSSRRQLEILDDAAQYVDISAYNQDAAFEDIFR